MPKNKPWKIIDSGCEHLRLCNEDVLQRLTGHEVKIFAHWMDTVSIVIIAKVMVGIGKDTGKGHR